MNRILRLYSTFRKQWPLLWFVLRDARAPWQARMLAWAAVLYVLVPVDLISDFIPVLGWLDDGVVLYMLFGLALRMLPPTNGPAPQWKP